MNKKLALNHPYSPSELKEINLQIEELIESRDFDEARLLQLVNQRDEIVQKHLKNIEKQQLKDFANAELSANKLLVDFTCGLQSESLGKLSALIRGRKAVEKYK